MALRFIDGASGYATAKGAEKWSTFGPPMSVTATNGRRSTASIRSTNWDSTLINVFDNQATWIIGFAINVSALPSVIKNLISVTDVGAPQCGIAIKPDGAIAAYRGDITGTLLGTSAVGVIVPGTFAYIEVQFTVNNTTGVVSVRKDNTSVLNLTAQNTRVTGNNFANQVMWIQNTVAEAITSIDLDDIYILDGTGALNNAFLGDCRVDNTVPNGSGSLSAWSAFGTTPTFTNVDDVLVNDDVDYNFASTAGSRELYAFPDIAPVLGTVAGVVVNLTVRKDDATVRTFRDLIKSGVTFWTGGTIFTPTTSYIRYMTVHEVDPNTSSPWTIANINSAEYGIDLVS